MIVSSLVLVDFHWLTVDSLYGNWSFRQRVSSPTTSLPTSEVDSPTSNVSSPTPLNYSIQGHFYPYTHINYSSFFHPLLSHSKKYFGHWVPKWLAYKHWRTDIRCWRIDFIRWRTGRWRSDSLAKQPVFVYISGLAVNYFSTSNWYKTNSWPVYHR